MCAWRHLKYMKEAFLKAKHSRKHLYIINTTHNTGTTWKAHFVRHNLKCKIGHEGAGRSNRGLIYEWMWIWMTVSAFECCGKWGEGWGTCNQTLERWNTWLTTITRKSTAKLSKAAKFVGFSECCEGKGVSNNLTSTSIQRCWCCEFIPWRQTENILLLQQAMGRKTWVILMRLFFRVH